MLRDAEMHNTIRRFSMSLIMSCFAMIGCDNDPAEQPESLEIPRVDILHLDEWLGMRLINTEQLRLLDELNLSQDKHTGGLRILQKCNERWSKFEYVRATGWPRKGTGASIDFYMRDEKVEVVFINFVELFEPEYPQERSL
jgi:hypothetical protein